MTDNPNYPNQYEELIKSLRSDIELSSKCLDFLDSELGRYLLTKAKEAEESAFQSFVDVDPQDVNAIREIQGNAAIPKLLFGWLEDAILAGNIAEPQYKELIEDE